MELSLCKECSAEELLKYGFKKCGVNNEMYKISIPLYRYKKIPVISVIFFVFVSEKYISYDVIDNNSGSIYIHLYNRNHSNPKRNKVLKSVINELNKCFENMKKANIISDYRKVK